MTADNHVHTRFSPDAKGDPEEFVLRAIKLGLKHIAFTEHVDLLYKSDPSFVMCDLDEYFGYARGLQNRYSDKIYVSVGLEVGYTAQNKNINADIINRYRPDYVINSVHEVGGVDCWFDSYFSGKTPEKAAREYFEAVLSSLNAPYPFDAVGHVGYVARNAPYDMPLAKLAPDLINEIFRTAVAADKIVEINASCPVTRGVTVPCAEVFGMYVNAGGKKTCFASDAHNPSDIGRGYDAFTKLCATAGIATQTVKQNGKEKSLPL